MHNYFSNQSVSSRRTSAHPGNGSHFLCICHLLSAIDGCKRTHQGATHGYAYPSLNDADQTFPMLESLHTKSLVETVCLFHSTCANASLMESHQTRSFPFQNSGLLFYNLFRCFYGFSRGSMCWHHALPIQHQ